MLLLLLLLDFHSPYLKNGESKVSIPGPWYQRISLEAVRELSDKTMKHMQHSIWYFNLEVASMDYKLECYCLLGLQRLETNL